MKNRIFERSLAVLLCLCMLIPMAPAGVFAIGNETPAYGDADGNGKIELDDILTIERFLAGLSDDIDLTKADANVDGVVDGTDIETLRQYLVGNIELPPELCTITFDSDGGDEVAPVLVGKGNIWKGELPTTNRQTGFFNCWVMPDGEPFYQNEPITSDITLKAVYGEVESSQTLSIDSFALINQKKDLEIQVVSDTYKTADEAKAHMKLLVKDGSGPVDIDVTGSNGQFTVSGHGGFNAGCSYELILEDGLDFRDKEKMIRRAAIIIERDEIDELKYNDSLIFLKDTDNMNYTVGGNTTDVLEASFLNNTGSSEAITGTFRMADGSLKAGDYVCIYENEDPRDRDYTDNLYEDDALAYIQITGIEGDVYSFRSLNEEDADEILLMPATIPFLVDELPEADSIGTLDKDLYDHDMWAKLGNTTAPEFREGDILVLYTVPSDLHTEDTQCRYAKITAVDDESIAYRAFPDGYGKDEIEDYITQNFFVSLDIDGNEIVDELNNDEGKALLNSIADDAFEGGFVVESMNVLFRNALDTKTALDQLKSNGFTDSDIEQLKTDSLIMSGDKILTAAGAAGGAGGSKRATLVVEGFSVVPTFCYGSRYEGGIGVVLDIGIELSVDKKISPTKTISLKLELGASFEQQIYVSLDVGIDSDIDWYIIYPDIKQFTVKTSFDIKSYTSVSVFAKMYTVQDVTSKAKWQALTDTTSGPKVQAMLRRLNRLGVLAKKAKGSLDALEEIKEQIEDILDQLPKVNVDGQEYSIEELEEMLGKQDVASEFDEVLSAEDETGNKVGIEQLMDKYNEMLDTECDWVELFNQVLVEKEIHLKVIAIKFTVTFIVTANFNIALGADLEYEMGKRYSFWIDVINTSSGSSEMDLLDERFGFQFYVMGTLGLKAGVRIDVAIGFVSTKIGSVGASVEVGPYLKLYGYFFYIYTKLRPMNTQTWDVNEEMQGALYIEFGIYLNVKFKAQVFDNTFKYETTLYSDSFPLLTAGVRYNVYDFTTQPDGDDVLYIEDSDASTLTGITMKLPETYLLMKTMDLMTGEKVQMYYPVDKFAITFSDSRFAIDENATISVNDIGSERYIECTMRIVWRCDKLAFSKYDIDITVPVVWTLMSETERSEKFTASVAVGNTNDGYRVVWSDRYTRLDSFYLPAEDEILAAIDYNGYIFEDFNLKYSDVPGYTVDKTVDLSIIGDTTYYFDITQREYTATVNGIIKEDGTVTSKVYTAPFGGSFDFSDLALTGANDTVNNVYSSLGSLTLGSDGTTELPSVLEANLFFYAAYGTDVELTANYIDDSRTVTFEFKGINAPAVKKLFRRGSIPDMAWISEYTAQYGGTGTTILGISPDPERVENSITYTVTCQTAPEAERYDINYVSEIDLGYTSHEYQTGSAIFRPSDPTEAGYTFVGWYSNDAMTEAFDFTARMPAHDVTVYVKWEKKQYDITLVSFGTTVATVKAKYNDPITTLTDPPMQSDYSFIGWYTNLDGGTKVTNGDTYAELGNITLYSRWIEKSSIDLNTAISFTPQQSATYDETAHSFTVTDNLSSDGNGFITWYKNEKSGYDWTTVLPVNAGTYEIAVSRDTDNVYLKLDRTVLSGAKLVINKADLTLTGGTSFTKGGVVAFSMPDGVKGNGRTSYTLLHVPKYTSVTSESPVIKNLEQGTYLCYFSVSEGDNYNAVSNYLFAGINVPKINDMEYDVYIRIKTNADDSFAGTDADVHASLILLGSSVITVPLNKDKDDFKLGSNEEYFICTVSAPWQIIGYTISCGDSDSLLMDEVEIKAKEKNGSRVVSLITNSGNTMLGFPSWVGESDFTENIGIGTFLRDETSFGNFPVDKTQHVYLDDTSAYSFDYDGIVTDSKYGTYDTMLYFDPPTFEVTSGNAAYDNFINFTGVTSFSIDKEGLAHYIGMNGGSDFTYTVTLKGSMTYSLDVKSYITVHVPESLPYSLNPEHQNAILSYSEEKPTMSLADATTGSTDDDLSELLINAKRGDEIELPIRVNSESIWGLMSETVFDNSALELIGWSYGDAADEELITVQNDMASSSFKVLVANSTPETMELNGTLITLRFKVKADAAIGDHKVIFTSARALDNEGENATLLSAAGTITVEDEKIPNTSDCFDLTLWSGLLILSLTAVAALTYRKKRFVHKIR